MKKKIISNILIILLFPLIAYAQLTDEEVLLEQLDIGAVNVALVKQSGAFNDVYLFQANAQLSIVNQDGVDNLAYLDLSGYDNRVWVNQKGDGNTYQLILDGTNNYIGLSQKGDYNTVVQDLKQASDLELVLFQVGNNNLIEHREFNALGTGVPVTVKQRGNGLHLVINNIQNF